MNFTQFLFPRTAEIFYKFFEAQLYKCLTERHRKQHDIVCLLVCPACLSCLFACAQPPDQISVISSVRLKSSHINKVRQQLFRSLPFIRSSYISAVGNDKKTTKKNDLFLHVKNDVRNDKKNDEKTIFSYM